MKTNIRKILFPRLFERIGALENSLDHYKTIGEETAGKLGDTSAELNKAQQVSKTDSWKWFIAENRLEWSDEMYNIFGVEKSGNLTDIIMTRIHTEDQKAVIATNKSVSEKVVPKLKFDSISISVLQTGIVRDINETRLNSLELLKEKNIAEKNEEKI